MLIREATRTAVPQHNFRVLGTLLPVPHPHTRVGRGQGHRKWVLLHGSGELCGVAPWCCHFYSKPPWLLCINCLWTTARRNQCHEHDPNRPQAVVILSFLRHGNCLAPGQAHPSLMELGLGLHQWASAYLGAGSSCWGHQSGRGGVHSAALCRGTCSKTSLLSSLNCPPRIPYMSG